MLVLTTLLAMDPICLICYRTRSVKIRKCKCGHKFPESCRRCFENQISDHIVNDNCDLLKQCNDCKEYEYKHTTHKCSCGWKKSYCPNDSNKADLEWYVEEHRKVDCPDYVYLLESGISYPLSLLPLTATCAKCKCIKTINHLELCPLICFMNYKFEKMLETAYWKFNEPIIQIV